MKSSTRQQPWPRVQSEAGQMQIGALAEKAGLTVRTIRYYEELGLIRPSNHTSGGFRLYDEESRKRLELIGHLKGMDLTLPEIQRMFHPKSERGRVREFYEIFSQRLDLIEAKIKALGEMKADICRTLRFLRCCRECTHGVAPEFDECRDCANLPHPASIPEIFRILLE